MNLNSLLNSVLSSGKKMLDSKMRDDNNAHKQSSSGQFDFLNSFGGGAATAGLLSLLLGSKGGRGLSKNVVKLGSMAAIGTLAYKAYQSWQEQNESNSTPNGNAISKIDLQPTHQRSEAEQENDAEIILQTMIAAASADGRIDEREQEAIFEDVAQSDLEAKDWLDNQMRHPKTPTEIASRIANDRALAAESYLAARIVCGDLDRKEIVFLHELSEALGLEQDLVDKLENQAGF